MSTLAIKNTKRVLYSGLLLMLFTALSCERSVNGLEEPGFSTDPNVFIDTFSGGLQYAAFANTVPTAFQVDREVTFNNTEASMRFEVPDAGDPRGAFAGGTFFTSAPRDLSQYDAITFYARASQAVTVGEFGLGNDLGANTFIASIANVAVNSNWKKYIIPLPDAAQLDSERGMFFFSAGADGNGRGYTFWVDEVKFETLGTIANPRAAILNGQDQVTSSFTGITTPIGGLQTIFNLPDGTDISVNASSAYFEFSSSNTNSATVDAVGNVTVGAAGTAVVTATLGGVQASGSLTVQSQGTFNAAPTPTEAANDVVSLFSDSYTNVPVNFFNGFWQFSTTGSADFEVGGDNVLNYIDLNFVGIDFPSIDLSAMTHLRMDFFLPTAIPAGTTFEVQVVDFGADQAFGGGDDTASQFEVFSNLNDGNWISFDISFVDFGVPTVNRQNVSQIILRTNANIPNFFLDNVYFRR